MDWIPFMFMADMMDDDKETVVIEDGKVVSGQAQATNSVSGWGIFSTVLFLAILATAGVLFFKGFKKKSKKKRRLHW
ncbi:hypothetical protein [Bacillus inaquosorum]|uniref:hypothetical protein n=1 Tax=Bacillus inaquosorum TaxID=483913 RepID=UPI00227EA0C6|nr:hypothetical protein [Bacillus inaquosorum]MCY8796292.1 hypothetical protein [Bacillus inaquosorum]MEC0772000.1 hypothetical protein [Bacillus inaquosorum]MEC0797369.1 hypothetical protein [Bacillus inaquosorum]